MATKLNYSVLAAFSQVHDDERLLARHLIPETHLQAASRGSGSHPHPQHQRGECSFLTPLRIIPGSQVVINHATQTLSFPGKVQSVS